MAHRGDGLFDPAQSRVGQRKVRVKRDLVAVELDGATDGFDRAAVLSALLRGDAQQVPGRRVVGFGGDQLTVHPFGQFELAGAMKVQRLLQRFGSRHEGDSR